MRSSRAPGTSKNACRFTWTRPKRKQKIPKHRKRKPRGPKASKCLQNSTNSHAFEPDHELSKSIIGATQGPQGGCRAPPGTTEAPGSTLPSVPGNVPGAPRTPRNSPRTLSRLPKRPQVSKKVPKAYQMPARRSLEGPRRQTETRKWATKPQRALKTSKPPATSSICRTKLPFIKLGHQASKPQSLRWPRRDTRSANNFIEFYHFCLINSDQY